VSSRKSRNQPRPFPQAHPPAQVEKTTVVSAGRFRSGPLPAPEEFAQYEQVLTGSAERLMRQFEIQSDHRRSLESQVVGSNIANERRGMNIGGVLAGMFIVGGFAAVMTGHDVAGYAAIGWAAAQISGTYIVTLIGRSRQLAKKRAPPEGE